MPEISVLMSVYNETESQITASIDSVLRQTFGDFELIIVHDSPDNEELFAFLRQMAERDDRIVLHQNHTNMGLALSMNEAAKLAKGQFLARMDADDVTMPERFAMQIECLEEGKYDLVFSNFYNIDETGKRISERVKFSNYTDGEIVKELCMRNIIHHPTVMMTRKIFDAAGGYRNFPCAQDYDLWLRMVNAGCRFHMITSPLLEYRQRETSVSAQKRLQQKLTIDYAQKLFVERLEKDSDSYSYEAYSKYIGDRVFDAEREQRELEKNRKILQEAVRAKKEGNRTKWFLLRVRVMLLSRIYRESYMRKRAYARRLKRYSNRLTIKSTVTGKEV